MINKKNRTACKACRLRKCLLVGMSKSGSRYGRRSNWFKIHCLLQEQQQVTGNKDKTGSLMWGDNFKSIGAEGLKRESEDNNNTLTKDRERSPQHPPLPPASYSAEAAAALWAARNSFLPVQLPPSPMGMPFLPSPFPSMHGPQPPRFLLPFMHGLHPQQLSPSPSRSSISSHSHSPSPNHPPAPSPQNYPRHKVTEEQSIAILRSLGPVQDRPMDLSVKETSARHRRKNSSTRRVQGGGADCSSSSSDDELSFDDPVDQNDENFNKRKTPLDLTKSIRVTS